MPGYITQNEQGKIPFFITIHIYSEFGGRTGRFSILKILQPEKFLCCCNKTKKLQLGNSPQNTIAKIKMVPDRCLWLCLQEFWIMLVV